MAKTIDDYKKDYAAAQAAGDKAGMDAAHQGAEAIRAQSGYSGGVDGSQYIPLAPKNFQGSATGVKTYNNQQAATLDQMNANSKAWYTATSQEEKDRLHAENEYFASLLGGTVSYDPSSGKWSGSANVGYQSQYSSQVDSLLDSILNRKPFSYDYKTDPAYLAYEDKYKRLGDRAREDVLGDVASLNGGYASSWATSAASQAQNDYNQQLSDVIPTLYDAAYNRYITEDNMRRSDLGLLMDVDNTDYNRYRDTVSDAQWDKQFGLSEDQFQFDKDKFAYTQDQDELDRLMNKWQLTGVADAEVAKAFGVDVGKTTESYEFNKIQAELNQEKWGAEISKANAAEAQSAEEQKLLETKLISRVRPKVEIGEAEAAAMEIYNSVTSPLDYYRIGAEAGISDYILDSVFNDLYEEALSGGGEKRTEVYWKNLAAGSSDPVAFIEEHYNEITADGIDFMKLKDEVYSLY